MPAKAKSSNKYTLGQKKSSGLQDVTLPSGATCQARRPGVPGLIEAGLLDSFDELTALVQTEHIAPNTGRGIAGTPPVTPADTQAATAALMMDKEKLSMALWLMDRIAVYCIVQPSVWVDYQMKGETDEAFAERAAKAEADESVAIRDVDLDDKIFLLNWAVGGTSDLAAFRQGTQQLMDNVAPSAAL